MVDYKRLGERIAQTRKSQKLSQEKLAELADITATNLSHIERGKIKTSIETLVAIANALNVTSNDLLCDSLNHSTQELKNQIAACLDGCTGIASYSRCCRRCKKENERIKKTCRICGTSFFRLKFSPFCNATKNSSHYRAVHTQ